MEGRRRRRRCEPAAEGKFSFWRCRCRRADVDGAEAEVQLLVLAHLLVAEAAAPSSCGGGAHPSWRRHNVLAWPVGSAWASVCVAASRTRGAASATTRRPSARPLRALRKAPLRQGNTPLRQAPPAPSRRPRRALCKAPLRRGNTRLSKARRWCRCAESLWLGLIGQLLEHLETVSTWIPWAPTVAESSGSESRRVPGGGYWR